MEMAPLLLLLQVLLPLLPHPPQVQFQQQHQPLLLPLLLLNPLLLFQLPLLVMPLVVPISVIVMQVVLLHAPRLVEEREPQLRPAVGDDDLDQRAATVAHLARVDPRDFGGRFIYLLCGRSA